MSRVSGVFLAEGETYEAVIEKDLIVCNENNVTPGKIGLRIKHVLEEYYKVRKEIGGDEMILWDNPSDEIIELVRKMPPPLNCSGYGKKHVFDVETIKIWFPAIVETKFGKFLVINQGTLGYQSCLFPKDDSICGCNSYGSTDYVICNLSIKDPATEDHPSISFGGLIIHLLIKHSFFEGNVMYRLDPINAMHTLGFLPNYVDYSKYLLMKKDQLIKLCKKWKVKYSTRMTKVELVDLLKEYIEEQFEEKAENQSEEKVEE